MVDASSDCYIDGTSQYGFNLAIGYESGSFVSKSGKIKLVSLSSCEAERTGLCFCSTEVVYTRRLLTDLGFPQ